MQNSLATKFSKEEIFQSLDEGLQPIIDNIDVEKLSDDDKLAIKKSLNKLEALALKIKADIKND